MTISQDYIKIEKPNSLVLEKIDSTPSNKVLFIDRDGVMITDVGHISDTEKVCLCTGLNNLLKYFKDMEYIICVVTNQSSVARKLINKDKYVAITEKMLSMIPGFLWPEYIIASFFHNDFSVTTEESHWRKPETGMFDFMNTRYVVDKKESIMIGDKLSDIEAASKFGIKNLIYIKSEQHKEEKIKVQAWEKANNLEVLHINKLDEIRIKFK